MSTEMLRGQILDKMPEIANMKIRVEPIIVVLPDGINAFCMKNNAYKANREYPEVGEELTFVVMEFSKEECRLILSHRHSWNGETLG